MAWKAEHLPNSRHLGQDVPVFRKRAFAVTVILGLRVYKQALDHGCWWHAGAESRRLRDGGKPGTVEAEQMSKHVPRKARMLTIARGIAADPSFQCKHR